MKKVHIPTIVVLIALFLLLLWAYHRFIANKG